MGTYRGAERGIGGVGMGKEGGKGNIRKIGILKGTMEKGKGERGQGEKGKERGKRKLIRKIGN